MALLLQAYGTLTRVRATSPVVIRRETCSSFVVFSVSVHVELFLDDVAEPPVSAEELVPADS